MPLQSWDATLSDFDEVFERFQMSETTAGGNSQPPLKFLLFLADKDPSTNLSWCPDCNVAEPVIYEKLGSSSSNVSLLKVYVGDKPTWRNPNHPWRLDSRFNLKGVPTLIRWENGAIAGRLEDNEAHLGDKIDALLGEGAHAVTLELPAFPFFDS